MLALRLTVFTLLFCGTSGFSGYRFNMVNHCDPPDQVVGKFCATLVDNDINDDGRVDRTDFDFDSLFYNYDDDLCASPEWEFITRWTCRYGYSEEYARYVNALFNSGSLDFNSFNESHAFFVSMQYTRFQKYCSDSKNRLNPVDRVQCAEVDDLQPADVKCA